MLSDIEIARAKKLAPIAEIAAKIGAPADALHPYGRSIAKIDTGYLDSLKNKQIGRAHV